VNHRGTLTFINLIDKEFLGRIVPPSQDDAGGVGAVGRLDEPAPAARVMSEICKVSTAHELTSL
jgi:hypothetical protein